MMFFFAADKQLFLFNLFNPFNNLARIPNLIASSFLAKNAIDDLIIFDLVNVTLFFNWMFYNSHLLKINFHAGSNCIK